VRTTLRRGHLDGVALAVMLGCCVLWGAQQVVVKATLPLLPPFLQASLRSAIAVALLFGWSRWRGIALFDRDGTLVPGLAAGALFACEFLCIYGALPLTSASRVSVFIYLAPFIVALALPRFEPSERLSAIQMAGMICAFAALAYAFAEGFSAPARSQWIGDGLAVLGAFMWGGTTLVIRATRLAHAAPEKTLLYQLAAATIVLHGASLAVGERWPAAGLPAWGWASMAFQAGVIAFASFLAWFWLLARYPATRLSSLSFLTPAFGMLFAALVLGEAIGLRLSIAMAFIAIGIALVNRKVVMPEPV